MGRGFGLGSLLSAGAVSVGLLVATSQAMASIEVVESVPLETTLAVPGIRQTQAVWLELVSGAQASIDIEQFYVNEVAGQSLTPVIQAVQAAAARGVKVRFIFDNGMYQSTYSAVPQALNQVPGIEVRTVDFSSHGGIMHAKYMVIDGVKAYVGSANFDWLALSHIHEVGLNIADAQTGTLLESIFNKDWSASVPVSAPSTHKPLGTAQAASGVLMQALTSFKDATLQVLASPPDDNPAGVAGTLDAIVGLMGSAKQKLCIQVYEYNTRTSSTSEVAQGATSSGGWRNLDNAIRAAANRGVQVELAVDATALKAGKADLVALAGLRNVQVKVVTIPQWSGGHLDYARLIHSKYLVVDDVSAWVGSENWNEGYFTNTRNVGSLVQGADVANALQSVFDQVWTSAYTSAP